MPNVHLQQKEAGRDMLPQDILRGTYEDTSPPIRFLVHLDGGVRFALRQQQLLCLAPVAL